jgi:hypothetical protein
MTNNSTIVRYWESADKVKYFAEQCPITKMWMVVSMVSGFPQTEAWDDLLANKQDAEDIAKLLSERKL